MSHIVRSILRIATAAGLALALAACERPPVESTQQGYRGTGMQQVVNPRRLAALEAARPEVPADLPAVPGEGPKAKDVYQNVQVLGDLPVADFARHMNAITQWVSPQQSCAYCHTSNFAEDTKYTKVVARRMIQMTQHLNANWKQHTGNTGVTCYTCHAGQPVPSQVWYQPLAPKGNLNTMLGNDQGQNKATGPGVTSLPYDPFSGYLAGGKEKEIKVSGKAALPQAAEGVSLPHTEHTYSLMMHFSNALGTNCTTCHNTQSFQQWVPKKMTAWHGIRMARDINNNYLTPLTSNFPVERLGPNGDVAKAFCATCHQGQAKPVGGQQMAKLYTGLLTPTGTTAATGAAPAAAAAAAATTPMAAAPVTAASAAGAVAPSAASASPATPAASAAR